ncbi:hypothetical protein DWX43_26570 [Clostridium sp. AF19-22AC]|nr:hypothetical protein DWX43_26570 [Clostridium sp. AF19-22AC]
MISNRFFFRIIILQNKNTRLSHFNLRLTAAYFLIFFIIFFDQTYIMLEFEQKTDYITHFKEGGELDKCMSKTI